MSTTSKPAATGLRAKNMQPLIGSLLRLPREHIVQRMLADVNAHGLDLSDVELQLFMYPGPDGRRPSELARQCQMSRQAMNYVLAGLERRGYLEPRDGSNQATRVVRMTARGHTVLTRMRNCVVTVEGEWIAHLGEKRFVALRDTLQDLTAWLGDPAG